MTTYEKIRAALESIRTCNDMTGERGEALTALAELERAAKEPVATVCLVTDRFAHNHCIEAQLQVEPVTQLPIGTKLYAAPPAPVAEIREPVEVDDEIARKLWREWFDAGCMTGLDTARFWLRVWQRELGPTLGMVPPDARADARIAELERDAARYRYLARLMRGEPELMGDAYGFRWALPDGILSDRTTLAAAIDEARAGNGGEG